MINWIEGEPTKTGYYLVQVRRTGHPQGNIWFFLARVVISPDVCNGCPIYMDHHCGNGKKTFMGGHVVGYCEPTPENFALAFAEIVKFYKDS